MLQVAFEIALVQQESSNRWNIGGRAYTDIKVNDDLKTSVETQASLRVVGITTYGKQTDILSRMMTGTLLLEGKFDSSEKDFMFLYVDN